MFFFLSLLRLILDSDGSVRGDLDIARIGDECIKHGCSCDGVGELELDHDGSDGRIRSVARQQPSTVTFIVATNLERIDQVARVGLEVRLSG